LQVKKAVSRITSVLVFLIFAAGLFVFISVIMSSRSGVPNLLGYSFFSVKTSSMVPTYPVGSVVITKKVNTNTLKAGDVITFYSDDPIISGIPNTHRIIAIGKDKEGKTYFITKGDNNPTADKYPVYEAKVIGKVQGSIGSLGSILGKFKNRYAMFFLLIVPIVLIVVFELKNITKLIKPGGKGEKTETGTEPENKE